LYEDVSDDSTYNHLHEDLKTVAIQTHYSVIRGSHLPHDDSEAPKELDTEDENNSEAGGSLMRQQSAKCSTSADSLGAGGYFTLEKN
jgi:hypothetical protein